MARRILIGVIGTTAALIAVGFVTWAFFIDTASSNANTFGATALDLVIKNNDTPWLQDLPSDKPTWTMLDMYPGQEMDWVYAQTRQIDVKVATGTASTVDIGCSNVVVDPPGPSSDTEEGTTDMDTMLEITWGEYENSELYTLVDPANPSANLVSDANGNGYPDLDDLERVPVTGLKAPTGTGRLQLRVRFRPEADSDYQGDSVVSTFKITAHQ